MVELKLYSIKTHPTLLKEFKKEVKLKEFVSFGYILEGKKLGSFVNSHK